MTTADSKGPAAEWRTHGRHRCRVRGDVLFWECHGPMQVVDLKAMFDERIALQHQHRYVLAIIDARDIDGVPADTRRYAVQFKPDPPLVGATVVIGASMLSRTLISLIIRAARLLGRREQELASLHFIEGEPQAWSLIERERQALRAALK